MPLLDLTQFHMTVKKCISNCMELLSKKNWGGGFTHN